MPPTKMTSRQGRMYQDLVTTISRTMMDLAQPMLLKGNLPKAWKDISATPQPAKVRITMRVDADVAKFYRALGRDYQRVMNDVLRTFMLSRLTEVLPEPNLVDVKDDDPITQALIEQEVQLKALLESVRHERLG